jgi:SAM-dependent methyltransferase
VNSSIGGPQPLPPPRSPSPARPRRPPQEAPPAADRRNLDRSTVEGFGREWETYTQGGLDAAEREELFSRYFSLLDWAALPPGSEGFDLGCGSGRWAALVAPRVGRLHCIDASARALETARRNLAGLTNCTFHEASVDRIPLADASMDFGYSLGVLHHVPDPGAGLRDCVRKLKPGAPFLLYLYYAFDNQPGWYRGLWRITDLARTVISRLPFAARRATTDVIAAGVYYPLARTARALARLGADTSSFPLAFYRDRSYYTMRTDALDRFGTRLEHRFTKGEVVDLMRGAGLDGIHLADDAPYWRACGVRTLS